MEILLIGVNHRTAPLELRERVAFTPEQARRAAEELRAKEILAETVVISTCNRSELYGVPLIDAGHGSAAVEEFLAAFHRMSAEELNGSLYRRANQDAVRHLFRVASGLDSMLLGEAEILGQVRDCYRAALEAGATGPVLNRMFQGALEVGKRVRTETEVGTRPMSVAFAGVKLAEQIFGKLSEHRALILGAGQVGEQVVSRLRDRGIARVLVANRSRERGEELAGRVGGEAVVWEEFPYALETCDLVVSSVGGTDRAVTRAMLERAMAARSNRAMFVIDLGVPRNVEPEAAELYNIYLYNLDDLGAIVEQNKKAREQEVPRAEALVDEHVTKFEAWQAKSEAAAVVSALRAKLHKDGDAFLQGRLDEMADLNAEERERVKRLAVEMLDRVVLDPVEKIGHERGTRYRLMDLQALRKLFGLDEDES
jgi:glutamyl-tRNA reductase